MAHRASRGRLTPAGVGTTLLLSCVLLLAGAQWVNHAQLRGPVCAEPGLVCTPATSPTAFRVQGLPVILPPALLAHPLQVQVDTALVRRGCDGRWTVGFGARLDAGALAVGPHLASTAACADVFLSSAHAEVSGGQVRVGDCLANLDTVRADWEDALEARVSARVPPEASAACAALLPAALRSALSKPASAQQVDLTLRYAMPYARRAALKPAVSADGGQPTGWVRRGLGLMDTVHDLRVALPGGSMAVRLATTPGAAASAAAVPSPELTLSFSAAGGVLALLPDELQAVSGGPAPLTLRWHLDHDTGEAQVNGRPVRRRLPAPRAPGPTVLNAAECPRQAAAAATEPAPSLYFVEAGDRGEPVDPAQSQAAFDAVEAATAGPGVLVSVFVHGWQHSAAPGDSYVCDYGRLIGAIGTMETQAARASHRTPRQVVGVYVGWPGTLYPDDLANGTTFWNRLEAADRLGATGALLQQVVDGLSQRVARRADETRADRRSALIVTGHSLGGRAVFHAVRDGLVAPARDGAGVARPDLVLLVNPAFSAELYRDIDAKARQCQPIGMQLLSFSSEADQVTRQVYPAGQAMTFDPRAGRAAPFPEHVYTAANFGEFVTHRLRMDVLQGDPPGPTDAQSIVRGFQRVPAGSRELYADNPVTVFRQPDAGFPRAQDAWYRMRLERVANEPPACPDNRARVIEVDARVLPNHGVIFTPAFMEYVVRVLNGVVGAPKG